MNISLVYVLVQAIRKFFIKEIKNSGIMVILTVLVVIVMLVVLLILAAIDKCSNGRNK